MRQTQAWRFGDFTLAVARREAWRRGEPLLLSPKVFDCVVYLIEHRDRAVGRDELIAGVWGRTDASDNVLAQTILLARRAFEDTGREQHVIRTVQRFGYHWVAPVEATDAPVAPAAPAATSPAPTAPLPAATTARPERRHRTGGRTLALALSLAAVLAAGWWIGRVRTPPSPARAANAALVLVLPVAVDAGAGLAWVRLGGMDLVAERLRAAGIAVVPSDNVIALTRSMADPSGPRVRSLLSAATGAAWIVVPSADRVGGRWQVLLRAAHAGDRTLVAEAASGDVLDAARMAADRLAEKLGGHAAAPAGGQVGGLDRLLRRVDAAILATRLEEARGLLDAVDAAARESPAVQLRLARIDFRAGRMAEARRRFETLLARLPAESEPALRASVLRGLGSVLGEAGNARAALLRFDEAVALLEGRHAPEALGKVLNDRATARGSLGQAEGALADFAQARLLLAEAGDSLGVAVVDLNGAVLDMKRDHLIEAAPVLARAARRFEQFGIPAAELQARIAAAEVALALLDPAGALAMGARLGELAAGASDPARARAARFTVAVTLAASGRLHEARSRFARLRDEGVRSGDTQLVASIDAQRAVLDLATGNAAAAAAAAAAALATLSPGEDVRLVAETRLQHVQALVSMGARDAAREAVDAFARWSGPGPAGSVEVRLALARAAIAAEGGDGAAARSAFEHALSVADDARVPVDLLRVAEDFVPWLLRAGEGQRASAVAGRLAPWVNASYPAALVQLQLAHASGQADAWRQALQRAKVLAGERPVPPSLAQVPGPVPARP